MSPETESLLEQMRDNLGAISPYAVAGAAGAALNEISRLRAENEKLRTVLEDLLSWFPGAPTKPQWVLAAGEYGADDAIDAAREALTEQSS